MNKRLITTICVLALVGSSPAYAWRHHHSHHHHHRGTAAALGFLGGFAVGRIVNRPAPPRTVIYSTPVYSTPVYSTPIYTAPIYQTPAAQAFRSQSSFVRHQLQAKLQRMGFYHSYIDGTWGPGTQSALENYASSTGNIQLLTSYTGVNEIIRMVLSDGA